MERRHAGDSFVVLARWIHQGPLSVAGFYAVAIAIAAVFFVFG